MPRRGPSPAPTAIKRAGGVRADRLNPAEPVPPGGVLACPEFLAGEGREMWHRLTPELHARGVLTAWDADLFALVCDLYAQVGRARQLLGPGLLVKGRRDGLITNPAWRIYRDGIAELRALAQEFGLTPSARSRIRVPDLPEVPPPAD